MAVVPLSTRSRYTSDFQAVQDGFCKKIIKRFIFEFHDGSSRTKLNRIACSSSRKDDFRMRTKQSCMLSEYDGEYRDVLSPVCYALEPDSTEQHRKSLEMYLESLRRQVEPELSKGGSDISENEDQSRDSRLLQAKKGLQSLDRYIAILRNDAKSEDCLPFTTGRNPSRMTEDSAVRYVNVTKQKAIYDRKSKSSYLCDAKDSGNLHLISILISMNIAVFLFEIASPIKNSDSDLWSLPSMYGAKVNDLIMVGEWWRLVTPMFLHAGLLHVGLSSWVLLSFGPQVCKGYGAFTFVLIYILGGISGNFTSFLHTSDPTVGGSGPVFAVIGAWLIFQAQNKDITAKENIESMFQKAIITTAFSFILANFGPIDNWANLGAAISGIGYGFLTSATVQIDDASSGTSVGNTIKEEMMTLSRQTINNPCKSLFIFTLFVCFLSSLLLFVESPIGTLELQENVQIVE